MLRLETRVRARALQLLYAWDVSGQPPLHAVAERLYDVHRGRARDWERGEALAQAVADRAGELDDRISDDLARWRLERVGITERNILRVAVYELLTSDLPVAVIISEALRLARWFAGAKSPPLINGVLDPLARRLGRA